LDLFVRAQSIAVLPKSLFFFQAITVSFLKLFLTNEVHGILTRFVQTNLSSIRQYQTNFQATPDTVFQQST